MADPNLQIVVETIQEQIRQSNASQNKILRMGLKGNRIYVEAESKILLDKLNHISGKIDGIKDTIAEHDETITAMQPIRNTYDRLKKVKTWVWLFAAGFGLFIIFSFLYNTFGLVRIISFFVNRI